MSTLCSLSISELAIRFVGIPQGRRGMYMYNTEAVHRLLESAPTLIGDLLAGLVAVP
jgi:hypothetical protein